VTLRCVIDTNVLISGFLINYSMPDKAVRKARSIGKLIFTQQTLEELIAVIQHSKFDRYIISGYREEFLSIVMGKADIVTVTRAIKACRDPKDEKFLEAAVHGDADFLITWDADLLMLHPFMKVAILTPADFLASG